ncbi:MAG: hypothetical protein ACE5NC_04100 [Anaerolineae bacterium]
MGGLRWRVILSILLSAGWLIFVLLWAAFPAGRFGVFQNFTVCLVSFVAVGALLGILWAAYGLGFANTSLDEE